MVTRYGLSLLILFAGLPMAHLNATDPFNAAKEKEVRDAVYDNTPQIASPKRDFQSILVIPKSLADVYATHPKATLEVLVKVIEGGRPADSVLAAGYALELLNGPAGGVVCVEMFDKPAYDAVDKDWGATPRGHWLKKVRTKIAEKYPAK